MKNIFHPMWKKPPPSGADDGYSVMVLVYEIDAVTKQVVDSDLGFYVFEEGEWCIMGDISMNLSCWTEIPDPSEFMLDKDWEVVQHRGYQP